MSKKKTRIKKLKKQVSILTRQVNSLMYNQLSKFARENYRLDESYILSPEFINEIIEWERRAGIGIPFNNDGEGFPLDKTLSLDEIKEYIANIYFIESGDIELLKVFNK